MFENTRAFGSFSVNDVPAAKRFYGQTLGLQVTEMDGMLQIGTGGDGQTMVYQKPDHAPASFTVLNFPVDNINQAVDQLSERGVRFERYEGFDMDEKGIAHDGGVHIAWFKDPAGNILSVLQEQ
ncbi:MAG TPA: VOC family protein [Mycobacteriales bacterium]|jgi:Glyoxalase/Bleomycin resistance protein/Dioxygenase superfamily.